MNHAHLLLRKSEKLKGNRHEYTLRPVYYIVLYLLPVLNPKSYDGARVLEASGRPMLVIGRSYLVGPIQEGGEETGIAVDGTTKLTEKITE